MPKGKNPKTYQYRAGDSPTSLAAQWNVNPNQIFSANQGAFPFSNGQVINVPHTFNYGTSPQQQGGVNSPASPFSFNTPNSQHQGLGSAAFNGFFTPPAPTSQNNVGMYGPYMSNGQQMNQGYAPRTTDPNSVANVAQNPEFNTLSPEWQQKILDQAIASGAAAPGTTLADIVGNSTAQGGAVVGQQTINGQTLSINEAGQRLNAQGQVVWDPQTATRDVYGGKFRYAGQTRWGKNRFGKTVKQRLGSDNRWHIIHNGRRRGGGGNGGNGGNNNGGGVISSFGVVSFNASAG